MLTNHMKYSSTWSSYVLDQYGARTEHLDVTKNRQVFEIEKRFDPTPEVTDLVASIKEMITANSNPGWVELNQVDNELVIDVWMIEQSLLRAVNELLAKAEEQIEYRKRLQRHMVRVDSLIYFKLDAIGSNFDIPDHITSTVADRGEPCAVVEGNALVRYYGYLGTKYGIKSCTDLAKAAKRVLDLATSNQGKAEQS